MCDYLMVGVCDDDYVRDIKKTEEQFAACGASIEYFPYTKGISTSDIKTKMDSI